LVDVVGELGGRNSAQGRQGVERGEVDLDRLGGRRLGAPVHQPVVSPVPEWHEIGVCAGGDLGQVDLHPVGLVEGHAFVHPREQVLGSLVERVTRSARGITENCRVPCS
jgi:hypothetical protein